MNVHLCIDNNKTIKHVLLWSINHLKTITKLFWYFRHWKKGFAIWPLLWKRRHSVLFTRPVSKLQTWTWGMYEHFMYIILCSLIVLLMDTYMYNSTPDIYFFEVSQIMMEDYRGIIQVINTPSKTTGRVPGFRLFPMAFHERNCVIIISYLYLKKNHMCISTCIS